MSVCIVHPSTTFFDHPGNQMPHSVFPSPHQSVNFGSTIFQFEAEVPDQPRLPKVGRGCKWLSTLRERLTLYSSPSCSFAAKLLHDVIHYNAVTIREEERPDAVVLAAKLSSVGYYVFIRTALGGGAACFRNLRHEFLTVRGRGEHEGTEFIVEPAFRCQFEIPHPTEEYRSVLASVPVVFVGTGSRLTPLVQVLCAEMADSFETQALTLPPWRRTSSMLSKWLPARAKDTSVSAPPDSSSSSQSSSRRDSIDMVSAYYAQEQVLPPLPISRQTSFSTDQWQPAGPPIYGASPENDSTLHAPSIHHARLQQQRFQQQRDAEQANSGTAGCASSSSAATGKTAGGAKSCSTPTPVPSVRPDEQQPAGRSPPRSLLSVKLQGSSPPGGSPTSRLQRTSWQPQLAYPILTPPTTPHGETYVKTVCVSGFGLQADTHDDCPALGTAAGRGAQVFAEILEGRGDTQDDSLFL